MQSFRTLLIAQFQKLEKGNFKSFQLESQILKLWQNHKERANTPMKKMHKYYQLTVLRNRNKHGEKTHMANVAGN